MLIKQLIIHGNGMNLVGGTSLYVHDAVKGTVVVYDNGVVRR